MSGRSPPYGRGECELGDPGVRPFVPCKHLVPACPLRGCSPAALCPQTSGIPRRGWNWARRPEGGACGFHSYPRGSRHHAGQGAWAGRRPSCRALPGLSGAERRLGRACRWCPQPARSARFSREESPPFRRHRCSQFRLVSASLPACCLSRGLWRLSARRLSGVSLTRGSRGARGMFINSKLVRQLKASLPRGLSSSP